MQQYMCVCASPTQITKVTGVLGGSRVADSQKQDLFMRLPVKQHWFKETLRGQLLKK